ncbi:MAG: MerR family transcriptional regulator [Alphaproteobacteria bacterium]
MTSQPSYKVTQDDVCTSYDPPTRSQAGTAAPEAGKSATAFRTISEVADHLAVQQHVLRFWETKFSQVKPLKRGGGRRYYRPEDVELLKSIHHLLYTQGYTIKGVQKLFREQGKNKIRDAAPAAHVEVPVERTVAANAPQAQVAEANFSSAQRETLRMMLDELKDLRRMVGERG